MDTLMDIKTVLKKYGEITYTIADKMGITQPSVMQYANGKPTARKLEETARVIDCSPAKFFANWQASSPTSPPQWHDFRGQCSGGETRHSDIKRGHLERDVLVR